MKREFSAGGLVYRKLRMDNGQLRIEWLVRRPTPNPEYRGNLGWSFPKGWLDDRAGGLEAGPMASGEVRAGEGDLEEAARREVREEGGVEAKVIKKLKTLKIFFTDKNGEKVMKFITYFVMEWERDLPGGWGEETEEARWVSGEEAQGLLAFGNEKELLAKAKAAAGMVVSSRRDG